MYAVIEIELTAIEHAVCRNRNWACIMIGYWIVYNQLIHVLYVWLNLI